MKKALILASVASMIDQFNMSNIGLLQTMGYEVHVACNFLHGSTCSDEKIALLKEKLTQLGVQYYQVDFERSVSKIAQHVKSYKQVKKLADENEYDLIHCHSPIGGAICRLASRKARKKGTKMIYTAHGFHFYKGAPKLNWMIYYPIEKICSYWTDVLITINEEDYALAQKKMHAAKNAYVPGVGVNVNRFSNMVIDRKQKREELGVPEDAFLLMSVGELNQNKNHEVIIRAIAELRNAKIHYAIAGRGDLFDYLNNLAKELDISGQIHLLGFRSDIPELYKTADVCCFPSIREGLGLAAVEGMASGLPLVAADNRGTRSYCESGINGFIFEHHAVKEFSKCIEKLFDDRDLCIRMGKAGQETAAGYDVAIVNNEMLSIYNA